MEMSRPLKILRDITAVFVTALFMFPIFWWALTSIKPISAVFDKDRVNFFDFTPTFINYGVTLFGQSRSQIAIDEGLGMGVAGAEAYDSRMSILESIIVSIGATTVTMSVAVFAAYAISRMTFRGRGAYLNWVLGQRFMPPIAILIPLVSIYKVAGAVHGCALCANTGDERGEILMFVEDVGRHNAVDAIAGWMWLNGVSGADKIFYTTGRLTSEMVIKCAQIGVPFLLSRSGLTQMGHELARRLGITLIGRCQGKHYLLFTGAERFHGPGVTALA